MADVHELCAGQVGNGGAHLGSVEGATMYRTSQVEENGIPTTLFKPVDDAFARTEALRELGYDARIPPAWLVFEESSAEQVVRDGT